jgi:tRNA nucleotidyltransferase/poly(A) polymerase
MAARRLKQENLPARLPEAVRSAWQALAREGETYLVGGALRDMLLGRTPHDYDLATSLLPERARQILGWPERCLDAFGVLHGPQAGLEVVSLRSEGRYRDRRHPDEVRFGATLEEDLSRRDFTANALALDAAGRLHDPSGGLGDLRRGLLRTVGPAAERLKEDLLRILRAYRLAAELGWRLDPQLRQVARQLAPALKDVSQERVGEELWRLLRAAGGYQPLRWACEDGVLAAVLPSLRPTRPIAGPVPRLVGWTRGDPDEAMRRWQAFGWPREERRLAEAALRLRAEIAATAARPAWREALARAGADAADVLVLTGGSRRIAAFAGLYGREGVLDRGRLPLRGAELAAAEGLRGVEIGRREAELLRELWRNPACLTQSSRRNPGPLA